MDSLEGDNLRYGHVHRAELSFQILRVIVAEDVLRPAAVTDAHDHRRMVSGIREDLTTYGKMTSSLSSVGLSYFSLRSKWWHDSNIELNAAGKMCFILTPLF